MKAKTLLIVVLFLVGCSDGSDSGATPKSLFTTWVSVSSDFEIDITGGVLGQTIDFGFLYGTGEICICDFYASGTESSGNYTLSNCSYYSGGSGDPNCSLLNSNGNYTNNGTNLEVCDSGGCVTYK